MFLLFKSMLIKIKKTLGRFISILLIIAIGMGFFGGLRAASPSMLSTIETYYDKYKLMDVKILSSMGLTNDDIIALQELDSNITVIPSYSIDVLENGSPIRVHAIEDKVNTINLISGKMPSSDNECLADSNNYHLGDKITLVRNNINDYLNNTQYTVVGLVNSVLYVGHDKGISNVGNGKLSSFIFISTNNFNLDYYTESYIIMNNAIKYGAQSSDYKKIYDDLYNKLLKLKPIREAIRYEEILKEATDKINKIQEETNTKLEKAKKDLNSTKTILDNNQKEINSAKKKINDGIAELDNNLSVQGLNYYTLDTAITSLESTITTLQTELSTMDKTTEEYKAKEQYLNTLTTNLTSLKTAKETYKTLYNQLDQINKNQTSLDESYTKYNDGLTELIKKEKEAKDKINDAKKDLDSIEQPIWYMQNRTNNYGYNNFFDDASVVASISNIFPLFFILIVALIILNTITRMIEEERTEIGTLKSLGFSNSYIILMYILYTTIAAIIGATVGLIGGYIAIPNIVYNIYNVSYVLPELTITIKVIPFIVMILVGIALIIGVTIFGCLKELNDVPASLLRPKAPKKGKKVFLEKIKFIWKELSFIWKITIRNIFRYKKRIIMTVVGVAGSTALLLAGFGLRNSVSDIANQQYNKIIKYDALIVLDDEYSVLPNDIVSNLSANKIDKYLPVHEESYKFTDKENKINDVYLIATNSNNLNKYISLNDNITNKDLTIPEYGIVITNKMAKLLDAKVGNNIYIRNSNNQLFILNIKSIVKNYTLNYIYMSDEYYEIIFNQKLTYNSIIANVEDNKHDELAKTLINLDSVNAINFNIDNVNAFNKMIKGIDNIVYLIIISACLLATVILYNLTIININERIREISTLKVLGFNDKEIASYVYREIIILTIVGIGVGLGLGVLLLQFIINTAEPANMVFINEIKPLSYVYSVLLIVVFMFIVRTLTYFKLEKIDMIESLKSVE